MVTQWRATRCLLKCTCIQSVACNMGFPLSMGQGRYPDFQYHIRLCTTNRRTFAGILFIGRKEGVKAVDVSRAQSDRSEPVGRRCHKETLCIQHHVGTRSVMFCFVSPQERTTALVVAQTPNMGRTQYVMA